MIHLFLRNEVIFSTLASLKLNYCFITCEIFHLYITQASLIWQIDYPRPRRSFYVAFTQDWRKATNLPLSCQICCLRHRPDETHFGQKQQKCLKSRILLPLPKTRRNQFWSKAANMPRKQDFAASAEDPMKLPKIKGSKHASEAGFCCFCRWSRDKPKNIKQLSTN